MQSVAHVDVPAPRVCALLVIHCAESKKTAATAIILLFLFLVSTLYALIKLDQERSESDKYNHSTIPSRSSTARGRIPIARIAKRRPMGRDPDNNSWVR